MSTLMWTYLGCSRAQHLFSDVPFQCTSKRAAGYLEFHRDEVFLDGRK